MIDIATMDVKMLKEKVPINIGWISAADFQTDMVANDPAVCGST